MSSVNTITTQKKPLEATAFPSGEGRTGASSGAFPLSTTKCPGIKEIPTTYTPEKVHIVSTATLDVVGLASDMAIAERSIYRSILSDMSDPTSITADQAAAGSASLSSTPRAILKVVKEREKVKQSHAIGDEAGEISARLEVATGLVWTLSGATGLGSKTIKIVSSFEPHKGLLAGNALLSFIGGIFSAALNALFMIGAIRQSRRASHFYQEYKRQGKTFEALVGSIYVSSDKIHTWIEKDRVSLRVTGKAALEKAGIDSSLARTRFAHLDSARKLTMVRNLVQHFTQENHQLAAMAELYLKDEDIDSLDLPALVGLLLKVTNEQLVNEAHFEQAFGTKSLKLVKKAAEAGLQARMHADTTDAVRKDALEECEKLLAKIESDYALNQSAYKSTVLLTFVGMVLGIVGFFTLGPIGTAVVAGLSLALNLGNALQSLVLAEKFKGPVGCYDRAFIYVCMALTIIGIVAAITTFLVFGGAPIVFGLAMTVAIITLCVYGYGLYKLHKQDEEWNKEHPDVSVDDLISRVSQLSGTDAVDEETLKMIKQLPKAHRKAIVDEAAAATHADRIDFNNQDSQDRLKRAVQRAVTFYWKQWWHSHRHPYFEKQALKLQELLASIKNNDVVRANEIFYGEIEDSEVMDKVQKHFHRISATESSVQTLQHAVQAFREHQIVQIA